MRFVLGKLRIILFCFGNLFLFSYSYADNHNIYEIIDQLQKDIKDDAEDMRDKNKKDAKGENKPIKVHGEDLNKEIENLEIWNALEEGAEIGSKTASGALVTTLPEDFTRSRTFPNFIRMFADLDDASRDS